MSFTEIYPLDITSPVAVAREDYFNLGASTTTLGSIPRMFTGSSFELWTAKTGGSQLTIDVDYELMLSSSHYTSLASTPIYGGFRIINPLYEDVSIFATYSTIGSLTSSEFYNVMQEASSGVFRNVLINPNMDIAQRGISFPAIATAKYTLDRWRYDKAGTMVQTITQDTDVPNDLSQYSLKMDVTTADASIAAGDACVISQRIEGYNTFPLIGKTATISFWVKSTKTGIFCISLGNIGSDRVWVSEYTINQSEVWEYKTIFIDTFPSSGTWDFENSVGLLIKWTLAGGTNFQTTDLDQWQTVNLPVSANQVNACDSTANNFWLSQVQMNEGEFALPFQPRHYEEELALCERYGYMMDTDNLKESRMTLLTSNLFLFPFTHPTTMRAAPTFPTSYGTEGVDWSVVTTAAAAQTGFTLSSPWTRRDGFQIQADKTSHGLSDATIRITGNSKIFIDAEL